MFSALEPKNYKKPGIKNELMNLCTFYKDDVNLKDVLSALVSTIHGIFKNSTSDLLKAKDVLKFLIDAGMYIIFPNMCTLYRIYLTVPVTSANAERTFI